MGWVERVGEGSELREKRSKGAVARLYARKKKEKKRNLLLFPKNKVIARTRTRPMHIFSHNFRTICTCTESASQ